MGRNLFWSLALCTVFFVAPANLIADDAEEEGWQSCPLKFGSTKDDEFTFITCGGKGADIDSKISLPSGNGEGFAVEVGSNFISIDTDGDGKMDEKVKGRGDIVSLRLVYNDGRASPYAIRVFRESEWKFSRHCWMSGKVNGVPVVLIDDNSNGRYGDCGQDAIAIGDTSCATPLGKVVSIAGRLFEIKVDESGAMLSVKPWEGPTGKINVVSGYECEGKLVWAVFSSGDNFFDLAGSSRDFAVPAGTYTLLTGCAEAKSQRAFMSKGSMESLKVEEGNADSVEWGMPLKIDFTYTVKSGKVSINYSSIKVFGRGGELYTKFEPRPLIPDVQVRSTKTGDIIGKGRWSTS